MRWLSLGLSFIERCCQSQQDMLGPRSPQQLQAHRQAQTNTVTVTATIYAANWHCVGR
jgi:hypothetical protein